MRIDRVMTRNVITLHQDQTVVDAVKKMAGHGISGAPVVDDDGDLVGIITEKDILEALSSHSKKLEMVYPSLSMVSVAFVEKLGSKEAVELFGEIADSPVSRYMTRDVVVVRAGSSLASAVRTILKNEINRIPVLDDAGKLVGIVSRADIIRGLAGSGALTGDDGGD